MEGSVTRNNEKTYSNILQLCCLEVNVNPLMRLVVVWCNLIVGLYSAMSVTGLTYFTVLSFVQFRWGTIMLLPIQWDYYKALIAMHCS